MRLRGCRKVGRGGQRVRGCVMSTHGCHPSAFSAMIKRHTLAAALGGTVTGRGLTRTCLFYNPQKMKGAAYTHVFTGAVGYLRPADRKRTYGRYRSYGTFGRRHSCGVRRLSTTSGGSIRSVHSLVRRMHVPPRVNGCGICVVSRMRVLSATTFGTFLGALRRPPRRTVFVLTAARGRGVLPAVLDQYRVCSFDHVAIGSAMRRLRGMTHGRRVRTRPRTLGIVTRGTSKNVHSTLSVFSRMIDFAGKRVACRDIVRGLGMLSCRCCFGLASFFLRGGMTRYLLAFGGVLQGKFSNGRFVAKLASRFQGLLMDQSPSALRLLRTNTSVQSECRTRTRGYAPRFLCGTVGLYGSYSLGCQRDGGGHLLMRLALVRITRLATRPRSTKDKRNPGGRLSPIFRATRTGRSMTRPTRTAPTTATPISRPAPRPRPTTTDTRPCADALRRSRMPCAGDDPLPGIDAREGTPIVGTNDLNVSVHGARAIAARPTTQATSGTPIRRPITRA